MKLTTTALFVLFIIIGCARSHGPYSLATNGGLEQPGKKGIPRGYTTFKAWGAVPTFSMDDTVHHSGARSFRISATQPTQAWLRTEQFQVAPGEELHAVGWVKMQDIAGDKEGAPARVTLMAEFTGADGRTEQFAYLKDAVINKPSTKPTSTTPTTIYTTSDWQKVEGTTKVPAGTAKASIRFGMFNTQGTLWWDDLTVDSNTGLAVRVELKTPRLEPEAEVIPIVVVNREQRKGDVNAVIALGSQLKGTVLKLSGAATQPISIPMKIEEQRGELTSEAALFDNRMNTIHNDKYAVNVPEAIVLYPPIPTHWATEDGPPKIDLDVDIAVTQNQRETSTLTVTVIDKAKHELATRVNKSVQNGINHFRLETAALPEGEYTINAVLKYPDASEKTKEKQLIASQALGVIPRRAAKTVLNSNGYLEYDGKPIFPLGIFNGGGKMKEEADAGFNVTHSYNDVNVELGQRPKDLRAKAFLDQTQANGMKMLFLVPREYVFHRKWDDVRRRIRMFRNHPALLAWDEEEGIARGDMKMADLEKLRQIIAEEDPNHPLMVGDSRDQITRVTDRSNFFPVKYMDLGMWWWYPVPPGGQKADLLAGEELVKAKEFAPPTFLTLRNTDKPLWVGIQSYKKGDWARYPNPTEYRAQAYIAVIHGAKGLMWYAGSVEGGLFLKPDEGNWEYLKQLAHELREMSPVFMAATAEAPKFSPPNAPMSVMMKLEPNRAILLTANRGSTPVDVTFDVKPDSTNIPVLYESRNVSAASGKLTDHFDPYAVHVYQLRTSK